MELLPALIAGIAALSGVYLQARIQNRREKLAGKQAREDELFRLEFEKFKELEELLSRLVTAAQGTHRRDMPAEERFEILRQRLSLGFPNYPNLGEDLDGVWEAYFVVQEGDVRFANVKRLSHEVVKNCRTALMLDFPAALSPDTEISEEAILQRSFRRFVSTFFPTLEQRRVSSEREKNL